MPTDVPSPTTPEEDEGSLRRESFLSGHVFLSSWLVVCSWVRTIANVRRSSIKTSSTSTTTATTEEQIDQVFPPLLSSLESK